MLQLLMRYHRGHGGRRKETRRRRRKKKITYNEDDDDEDGVAHQDTLDEVLIACSDHDDSLLLAEIAA